MAGHLVLLLVVVVQHGIEPCYWAWRACMFLVFPRRGFW